jgi:protoheme IX farnesyltransferase
MLSEVKPLFFSLGALSDALELTKPRITAMAAILALSGMFLASGGSAFLADALWPLLGIALLVSGAGALNMYIERDSDKYMERTRNRPLPSGRLEPWAAIVVGAFCSLASSSILFWRTNSPTLILGLFSLICYVWIYTPLKKHTWLSLAIGAVPGAMPAVLGYTAIKGVLDVQGLALFFVAFLWQFPHFVAISIFREAEYVRAGCPVLSHVYGLPFARGFMVTTTGLLILSTVGLAMVAPSTSFFVVASLALGGWFFWSTVTGFSFERAEAWAKNVFFVSLCYQTLLFAILIIDLGIAWMV